MSALEIDLELDAARLAYLRDTPRLSYVQPDDAWWVQKLMSGIEVMFGRNRIEQIYHQLKAKPFNVRTFFKEALAQTEVNVEVEAAQIQKIPQTGPVVFLANHPFGILDGIILCDLALQARGDFRIMIHSLLCQDADLAPYFLPIDFQPNKQALRNNINSKNRALELLNKNIPILLFPSGMVSTAGRFGLGEVKDSPWTTFAAKLVRESGATVVPVNFSGQNSRKFHIASHIAEPLRMALLIHEALNKFGDTINVAVGDPIAPSDLEGIKDRQALTDHLYQVVQDTGRV